MEISRLNNIPDYQVQEKIYESSNSLIYRGVRKSDNLSVIFKVLNEDFQTPEKIDRFKNEYKIIHSLSIDGIIKVYDLIKYHDTLLMVLEDVGGETLKKLIPSKGFDILTFLELANKIVQILKEIHDLKIIHKNINPSNILWNRKINEIKIIDFSISAKFDAENKEISSKTIEGAINYISPEQTNRINRIIDYRTDFYSLGLTFYEMLTGQQAIDVKDPIEIIYWHIAKELSPLNKLNSDIPVTISNIILKLIEKQPEKRYQSCHGLQIDLINCLKQFKGKGFIDEFEIAKNDYTNKLIIPQKLYGRTNETKIIFDALDRTNNGSLEIMLVTGYAGIGKSRLIYEVQKHIAKNKGCFISGKFEQFKRNIPYFPIIHAFQDLIKQILSKSDENINNLKNNLLDILENNGKVISSVIPELNLIIGEQKELTPLPPIEAQNRFNLYFQKFITAFASEENPLILFLDDLQWADRDSLNLITTLLINPNAKYFYLIVAYRHNEIYNTHPLTHTLNTIEQSHKSNPIFNLNHIHLEPLENSNVSQLLSDTLHRDENVLNSLSMLISKKTLNNPLFIIQFLKALYDEKLLIFNQNQWEWKFEDILQRNLSDNIIDIIDNQIQKLSKDHKLILQIASCIGQQFDIKTLTYLIAKSDRDLAIALEELIDINYITPIGNINRYLKIDDISFNNFVLYKFLHDKIQKIAYLSIDEHDKKQIHLKIGEFLLANNQEHDTFNIVNHFNLAIDLITSQLEKTKLAKLNLDAAIKAKLSNAYDSALNYSAIGISLLSNDCWQFQYKLSLDLFMEGAESAYLCANFDQMDKWINVILKNSNSILDKGKAHEIKIHSYILQHKLQEAIETALNILKELDIKISKNPNIINTSYIFHKLKISYLNQDINNLIDLPVITDEHKLLAMRILASTSSATYFANPKLLPFVAANMINISVEFGLSPLSAVGFALYGIILCGTAKDIEIGYQLGKLAVKIIEKFNAKGLFAMLTLLYNLLIRHWVEPLSETLSPFIEGHQVGIETGSLEFASTCSLGYCLHLCFIGKNLEFVNQEIENYLAVTIKIGNIRNIFAFQVKKQLVFHLMNPKENNSFNFVDDNNIDLLPKLFDAKDFTTIFELHNYKSLLHYLFEDYELAYQHAFEAEKFIDASVGLINIPIWNFYYSLTLIKLSYKCDKNTRKIHLKKIMSMQKMMKKWSHHAPNNYLNKYYLVEAEIEQLIGEMPKAITLYHKAIEIAKENGFLNEEALAHELLANFWFNKGYENYGYSHIEYASHYYQIWGANAKVTHIAKKYPNRFLTKLTIKNDLLLDDTKMYSPQLLDLSTILKASQTISEEIILSNLLKKIMTLVIENAGAQKAYFILQREDKWFIEAESNTDPINIKTLHSVPVKDNNQISQSIINYVIRTKESLVLSDAANNESYLNDDYIRNNNPKSILCTPLLHHGKLNGILYLENNITTGAFTKDRLELLNLLIGQMAISIENAFLYENLERLVNVRTKELSDSEERYRLLVELSPDTIVIHVNGEIRFINQSGVKMYGADNSDDLIGKNILDFVHKRDKGIIVRYMKLLEKPGKILPTIEIQHVNLKNIITDIEGSSLSFYYRGELAILTICRDISERKKAERLREHTERIVKHDLKNPLSAILGFSSFLLSDNSLTQKHHESLSHIYTSGKKINTMISQSLDFLKMEENTYLLNPQDFNLMDLFDNLEKEFYYFDENKLNKFVYLLNGKPITLKDSYFISGEPIYIEVLLSNLIRNAVEASSRNKQITISIEDKEKYHQIDIHNFGTIPANIKDKFFEPYVTSGKKGGTGLGVYSASLIAKAHHGSLTFTSSKEEGTHLIIILPKSIKQNGNYNVDW